MKRIITIATIAPALMLCQCTAPAGPNTQRDAATGAVLGGIAGGIIGHQSGRGLEGAAIGAGAGAGAGALIGNEKDKRQYGY